MSKDDFQYLYLLFIVNSLFIPIDYFNIFFHKNQEWNWLLEIYNERVKSVGWIYFHSGVIKGLERMWEILRELFIITGNMPHFPRVWLKVFDFAVNDNSKVENIIKGVFVFDFLPQTNVDL